MSIGGIEILIVIAIVVVLFGAPIATFLLGYFVGRRSSRVVSPPETAAPQPPEEPSDE